MLDYIINNWVGIAAVILAVVRLLESVAELVKKPQLTSFVGKIKQVLINFFKIETYK